jgi:hypothetical protein
MHTQTPRRRRRNLDPRHPMDRRPRPTLPDRLRRRHRERHAHRCGAEHRRRTHGRRERGRRSDLDVSHATASVHGTLIARSTPPMLSSPLYPTDGADASVERQLPQQHRLLQPPEGTLRSADSTAAARARSKVQASLFYQNRDTAYPAANPQTPFVPCARRAITTGRCQSRTQNE